MREIVPPSMLLTQADGASARPRCIVHLDGDLTELALLRRADPRLAAEANLRPQVVVAAHSGQDRVTCACPLARSRGIFPGLSLGAVLHRLPRARILRGQSQAVAEALQPILADLQRLAPLVEQEALDGFFLDMTGCERLCGGDVARWTRRLVAWLHRRWRIGFSVGVATNKTVARLAMRAAKWGHVCEVRPGWEQGFMAGVPVYRLPGIGRALRRRLAEFGIRTAGQLSALGESTCAEVLGHRGRAIWHLSRGQCHEPVEPTALHDSIIVQASLTTACADPAVVDAQLVALAADLAASLRHHSLWTDRADLILTYSDGAIARGSLRLQCPSWLDPDWIAAARCALARAWTRRVAIRRIQLRTPLQAPRPDTADLIEDLRQTRHLRLYQALDQIRQRHGSHGLQCASTLPPSSPLTARPATPHKPPP